MIREPPRVVAEAFVSIFWAIVPLSWAYTAAYALPRLLGAASCAEGWGHIVHATLPPRVQTVLGGAAHALNSRVVFLYAVVEVLFSMYYQYLLFSVQPPAPPRTATREYVVKAVMSAFQDGLVGDELEKFLSYDKEAGPEVLPRAVQKLAYDDPRAQAFRKEMTGWFIGLRPEQVTEHDLCEWLSWALFGQFYEEVRDDDMPDSEDASASSRGRAQRRLELLHDAVRLFAARCGIDRFPEHVELTPEEQRSKRTMLLSLDPVRASARPLTLYLITWSLSEFAQFVWWWKYGFELRQMGSMRYLVHMPPGWSADAAARGEMALPLLFLHGLGVGVGQYYQAVRALMDPALSPRPRPVVIPLQPWSSYGLFSPRFLRPWHKEECVWMVQGVMQRHGLDACGLVVLSHSMGTISHSWLLKEMPEALKRNVFVDPVCFQLWAPQICYRFLYKKAVTFVEYVLRYFVAREVATANVLMRHFDWAANTLLLEHLPHRADPNRTRIYLAGADTVVDAPALAHFFERHGLAPVVVYRPGVHHGAFVLGPRTSLAQIVPELDAPLS